MGGVIPLGVIGGCSGAVTGGVFGVAASDIMDYEYKATRYAISTGAAIGASVEAEIGCFIAYLDEESDD